MRGVPRPRMHYQPRGLVDHQQRPVLEDDIERNLLRRHPSFGLDAGFNQDLLSANDPVTPPQLATIDLDGPGVDPSLQPGPGVLRQQPRQRLIEAQAGQIRGQSERMATELGGWIACRKSWCRIRYTGWIITARSQRKALICFLCLVCLCVVVCLCCVWFCSSRCV